MVNCTQLYVYDRQNSVINLLTKSKEGKPGNGQSADPDISMDGRWIVFRSDASNLTGNGTSNQWGIFVSDQKTGVIKRVLQAGNAPAISADGRYLVYSFDTNIYLNDLQVSREELITKGLNGQISDGMSGWPDISGDGRWVAFWSWAGNLINGDIEICREGEQTNYSCGDVFIYDNASGKIDRIPVGIGYGLGMGELTLSLSENGDRVAFECQVLDRRLNKAICKDCCGAKLSANGQYAIFRRGADFFVRNLSTDSITQVSVTSDGAPANGEYVYPRLSLEGEDFEPGFDISLDGHWAVFASTASNLIANDSNNCGDAFFTSHNCYNIFIHDLQTGITEWISKPGK
jgi:hypothetical protein